jgi:hypothetical protein
MFSQFFGQYLLERQHISPDQFRLVMALRDFSKAKLGFLAINAGYMTAAQVDDIHASQTVADKRFGEIALEEGALDQNQLETLLTQQAAMHVSLGQTLVDEGMMELADLERILAEYKRDCGLSESEFAALKSGETDVLAESLGKMPGLGPDNVYGGYLALFARNLVRFVDDNIKLERARLVEEAPYDLLVYQALLGRQNLFTGLAGPEGATGKFAICYGKLESVNRELTVDALGEFLNVQNGLFVTRLSNRYLEMDLGVPGHHCGGRLRTAGVMYAVPVVLPFGYVELIVATDEPAVF